VSFSFCTLELLESVFARSLSLHDWYLLLLTCIVSLSNDISDNVMM